MSVGKGLSGSVASLPRPSGWGVSADVMLMGEIVRHGGWVPHLYLGNSLLRAVVGGAGATSLTFVTDVQRRTSVLRFCLGDARCTASICKIVCFLLNSESRVDVSLLNATKGRESEFVDDAVFCFIFWSILIECFLGLRSSHSKTARKTCYLPKSMKFDQLKRKKTVERQIIYSRMKKSGKNF